MNQPQVILFTDLVGSTELYERLGSRRALELVKAQEDLLFPWVSRCGGRVVKTIGDSIMAVFPQPDPAVECAMAMQKALDGERQGKGKEPLCIRISLHSGEIIGSGADVFGDTVNVASRLQSLAGANQIVISRDLFEACSRELQQLCRSAGSFAVKGKAEKVEVFQVTWRGDFSEYRACLPQSLTFCVFTGSVFDVPAQGICVSRQGLELFAGSRRLKYSAQEITSHRIRLTIIRLEGRSDQFVCLYDERLWREPSVELYSENMFEVLCEAQKLKLTDFAVSPTGKARGFSRLRALRSTLEAYARYLRFSSTSVTPSICRLLWELPAYPSRYDLTALSSALRNYLAAIDVFAEDYRVVESPSQEGEAPDDRGIRMLLQMVLE